MSTENASNAAAGVAGYLVVRAAGQPLGVPVLHVRDVLRPQRILRIPAAPRAVAGALNLRGRIVTAIDLRICLGLPALDAPDRAMCVVVEHGGDFYGLLADQAGEVAKPPAEAFEPLPAHAPEAWRACIDGVYRHDAMLLPTLAIDRLMRRAEAEAA